MPFYLYGKTPINGGFSEYIQEREISLAGTNNVIYSSLTAANQLQQNQGQNAGIGWHLNEIDLLGTATEQYLNQPVLANEYAIVIDLKPNVANNVSLYEIKDIWGFSYSDYTPIALRIETLFGDLDHQNPDAFKKCFRDNNCLRDQVHEFLYLQGGYDSGKWLWGRVGMVNGALLWPDALEFFFREIQNRMQGGVP